MIFNRIVLGVAIYMMLTAAQCVTTGQLFNDAALACSIETNAHTFYVAVIAPNRPAAAVAREARLYATVQRLCQTGGTIDQINAAITNVQSVRQ